LQQSIQVSSLHFPGISVLLDPQHTSHDVNLRTMRGMFRNSKDRISTSTCVRSYETEPLKS